MCNACGFQCCAYDAFSGCGCDSCDEPDCWSDDELEGDELEDGDDDAFDPRDLEDEAQIRAVSTNDRMSATSASRAIMDRAMMGKAGAFTARAFRLMPLDPRPVGEFATRRPNHRQWPLRTMHRCCPDAPGQQ